jgi:hypothetical protein
VVLRLPQGGEAMEEQLKWVGLTLAVVFFALAAFTILTFDFVATLVFFFPDWLIDRDWFEYPPIPIAQP